MGINKRLWDELTTATSYNDRPYDYAKNQLAHWALGILLTTVVSLILYSLLGEFAYKGILFLIMATIFFLWEFFQYRVSDKVVSLWDHFEDWMFMAVYGSGSAVFLFHESAPGEPYVWINIYHAGPLAGIISTHLVTGIVARQINRKKNAR